MVNTYSTNNYENLHIIRNHTKEKRAQEAKVGHDSANKIVVSTSKYMGYVLKTCVPVVSQDALINGLHSATDLTRYVSHKTGIALAKGWTRQAV